MSYSKYDTIGTHRRRKPRRPTVTKRTAERLVRLAYDLEHLANTMQAAGYNNDAAGVRAISSQAGDIGRSLRDRFTEFSS